MTDQAIEAAIVGVGSEVTAGDIENTNARWLAQRLEETPLTVRYHLAVKDDQDDILNVLRFLENQCSFIFMTGGLGPTTDDLTRKAIAGWAGRVLQYHPVSWHKIETRLNELGIPVSESNRQQCYFPAGATVIPNNAGTADAFMLVKDAVRLWALPGPPHELSALWEDDLEASLRSLIPARPRETLFRWHTLGKSESAVNDIVETVIAGAPLRSGYRARFPYIEVKIWCPENKLKSAEPTLARLESELSPWLAAKEDEDLAQILLDLLAPAGPITVTDHGTGGHLATRLSAAVRRYGEQRSCCLATLFHGDNDKSARAAPSPPVGIAITPIDTQGHWTIQVTTPNLNETIACALPYTYTLKHRERLRRFQAECSIFQLVKKLREAET